jgi:hypothetical protein
VWSFSEREAKNPNQFALNQHDFMPHHFYPATGV